jgi:hypothetical protein
MTEVSNKSRAAKAVDPNYCEVLGRPCHSKACNFGCKELRGGSWRLAKPAPEPMSAEPPAAGLVNMAGAIDSQVVAPATGEEPARSGTGIATKAPNWKNPTAPAAEEKLNQRRSRQSKPVIPETTIDLASLASGNKLAVLVAALEAMEHIDPIMSMAARMLGVSPAGTPLDTMRETKRRLAALIAELKETKRQTEG